jgi:hypothetical protein
MAFAKHCLTVEGNHIPSSAVALLVLAVTMSEFALVDEPVKVIRVIAMLTRRCSLCSAFTFAKRN